jgi:hypothetical protein
VAAAQFANNIISMMDSKEKMLSLIKHTAENLAEEDETVEAVEASITLEDLQALVAQLDIRINKKVKILTGKDSATAATVTRAVTNDYLAKRLKARALLMRVHQKVMHSLLVALPYKRRISRAKKGVF